MKKTLILLATIYPFIWLALYAFRYFPEINWPLHLSILLAVALLMTVFYIRQVFTNRSLTKDTRFIWLLGLLMFGSLAQVLYFVEHLGSSEEKTA